MWNEHIRDYFFDIDGNLIEKQLLQTEIDKLIKLYDPIEECNTPYFITQLIFYYLMTNNVKHQLEFESIFPKDDVDKIRKLIVIPKDDLVIKYNRIFTIPFLPKDNFLRLRKEIYENANIEYNDKDYYTACASYFVMNYLIPTDDIKSQDIYAALTRHIDALPVLIVYIQDYISNNNISFTKQSMLYKFFMDEKFWDGLRKKMFKFDNYFIKSNMYTGDKPNIFCIGIFYCNYIIEMDIFDKSIQNTNIKYEFNTVMDSIPDA